MTIHSMQVETFEDGINVLTCPTCDRKLVFDGKGNASVEKQGNFFVWHQFFNPASGITKIKLGSSWK